jgi:hypothetical protein
VDHLDGNLTKARRVQPLEETTTHAFSYGCLFLGADPLGSAWPRGLRIFLVDKLNRPSAVEARALGTYDYQRFDRVNWKQFFANHPDPPDVLALRIPQNPELEADWENRFLNRGAGKRPKYLVVLERAGDVLRNHSSAYRACVKRFQRAGYEGVLTHVDSSSCGSPTWGSFFTAVYYQKLLGIDDDIALKLIGNPELLPRS